MEPNDVPRVTPQEFWKAREAGRQVALVDVRGPGENSAARAAAAAASLSRPNVAALAGGLEAWTAAGLSEP